MEAEDLVLDDCCQGQVIEEFRKLFPDIWVSVLPQALIVKTIYLRDLSALVVTSEDG